MIYWCIGLSVVVLILFIGMVSTTNHNDARTSHVEEYMKVYSQELKNIKNMLRAEIPETAQEIYAKFMKEHLPFVPYDEIGKENKK